MFEHGHKGKDSSCKRKRSVTPSTRGSGLPAEQFQLWEGAGGAGTGWALLLASPVGEQWVSIHFLMCL